MATRYILERPAVGEAIIGARNVDHLADNLRAFTFSLDTQDYQNLNRVLDHKTDLDGDVWDLERGINGKHGSIMKWNLHSELDRSAK